MNPIDISFLLVMAYGIYKGSTGGFISSIASFGKVIMSLFIALRFSGLLSKIISKIFRVPEAFAPLAAFIIVFVLIFAFLMTIGNLLQFVVDASKLKTINKWIGTSFWLWVLAIGYSIMLTLGRESQLIPPAVHGTSLVVPYVEPLADVLVCKLQSTAFPAFGEVFTSLKTAILQLFDFLLGKCK